MPRANSTDAAAVQPEFTFGEPIVTPLGDGRFVVAPGRPKSGIEEVGTTRAARILGYKARSSIHEEVLNHPKAHLLKWRYTPGGGKILFELPSLLVFKEAVRDQGK